MPNRDKKGPEGKGSGTGRRMGVCSPEEMKNIEKETDAAVDSLRIGRRNGQGRRPRKGRGFRNRGK